MKTWEYARKLFEREPVELVYEEESDWTNPTLQEKELQEFYIQWQSKAPGSGAPASLLAGAISSVENMGYDTSEAEKLFKKGLKAYEKKDHPPLIKITAEIYQLLHHAKKVKDHPYHKYASYEREEDYWNTIEKVTDVKKVQHVEEKIRWGWWGQITAGAFGTALEGYSAKAVQKAYPSFNGYVKPPSPYNDDITFQLVFLHTLLEKKEKITSNDIALNWNSLIPFGWSAENIALKNIRLGLKPPECGIHCNPFREWIGAQMRGSVCGFVAPGNPSMAAHLAWVDALISHTNNGVLGEVFNAVMTSFAFIEKDIRVILEKSLAYLPKDSQFYEVVAKTLEDCKKYEDPYKVLEIADKRWRNYDLVHAFPNMAIEIIALWYSEGDFEKGLTLTAHGGLDVDSSAGQVGSILGVLNYQKGIDSKWISPIGSTLKTYVRTYESLEIEKLVRDTLKAVRWVRKIKF